MCSATNEALVDFAGHQVSLPCNGFLGACTDVDAYDKLNRIGEGTYGIVYRAQHRRSGSIVALKRMRVDVGSGSSHGLPLSSFREIALLRRMRHKNIVSVLEIAAGHSIDSIFMVMEFCECDLGSLLDSMHAPFAPSEVKSLLHQLLSGLAYCHSLSVIHRDLKLPNALLTRSGQLKIADFGLARFFHKPARPMTPQVVTLWYRAPELIFGATEYSSAIDLWSAGCILGELLTHRPFMPGKTEQEQLDLIVDMIGAPTERIWPGFRQLPMAPLLHIAKNKPLNNLKLAVPHVSTNTILLLNALLTYDPKKRLSVHAALDHPYFYEMPTATRPVIK